MPRAIWTGSISFGLVNVPVRMYSAIEDHDVRFHLLHEKDDSRIGYEKVCKKEGKPVPDDEIARGYEVSEGTYVYLTDDDLEAVSGGALNAYTQAASLNFSKVLPAVQNGLLLPAVHVKLQKVTPGDGSV